MNTLRNHFFDPSKEVIGTILVRQTQIKDGFLANDWRREAETDTVDSSRWGSVALMRGVFLKIFLMKDVFQGLVSACKAVRILKLSKAARTEYRFRFVACLLVFVR